MALALKLAAHFAAAYSGRACFMLFFMLLLPYILCKDSFFARFHAKQGLALFVFGAIADVIGAIFPIGWLLTLFRVYCVIKGLLSALDGKMEPLPILGKYIKYE